MGSGPEQRPEDEDVVSLSQEAPLLPCLHPLPAEHSRSIPPNAPAQEKGTLETSGPSPSPGGHSSHRDSQGGFASLRNGSTNVLFPTCHSRAGWPRASHFSSLGLSFFVYEMGGIFEFRVICCTIHSSFKIKGKMTAPAPKRW